jgi:hypothetical protein
VCLPYRGGTEYFRGVRLCCVLCLAIAVAAAPARAEEPAAAPIDEAPPAASEPASDEQLRQIFAGPIGHDPFPPAKPDVSLRRRAAATALAIVPGFVVHGIGAWTVREKPAAKTLIAAEGIGLAVAGLAGGLVGGSGGNPYTVLAVPFVVAGAGMFMQSWFTDIFVAAGGEAIVEQPRALAPWSVELGTTWLHDAYREQLMLRAGGRVALGCDRSMLGRIELGARALADTGGDAQLARGDVRVRIFGEPPTGRKIDDGSRLTARAGYRFHRDSADRISQQAGELEVNARLDLARVDEAFGRSFVDVGAGVGIVRVKYGDDVAHEWTSDLLASFAWGAYLGARGEAKLWYEHARDVLVGGIPAWRASGFIGHVGATLDVRVFGPWGVRGELAIGNGWLSTFAVSYRGGPQSPLTNADLGGLR